MDGSVVLIRVVLHVLFQATLVIDGEHVSVAGIVVERVTINIVRRLVGSKHKDGTGLGVRIIGFGVATHGVRRVVHNVCRRVDSERVPFLHASAIDCLAVVRESHP